MLGHGGRVEVQHTEALSRAMAATKTMVTLRKSMGKPWENGGLMGLNGIYPLVMTNITMVMLIIMFVC